MDNFLPAELICIHCKSEYNTVLEIIQLSTAYDL